MADCTFGHRGTLTARYPGWQPLLPRRWGGVGVRRRSASVQPRSLRRDGEIVTFGEDLAAVDQDRRAGDVGGFIGGQE